MSVRAAGTTRPRNAASAGFTGFPPQALRFLRAIARHNEKPWFEAHRADYEETVKTPLAALVEEMDARLGRLAPEMVGDRKRSVFRIHRDVRFSKDKSPYKTHVACWFFHRDVRTGATRDAGGGEGTAAAVHGSAGFYYHLQPGQSLCGGGIWMPPRPALVRIRARIAERPEEWASLVDAPAFRRRFGALDEEAMLTRVPRGFAAEHPAARWLRFQSFTAGHALGDEEATAATLPDQLERSFTALLPVVRWLNAALGLRAADRR
ncbi:MAG TPA: DUF2461 domain-containing protein [Gemmatirosa sp.]|nr:DUF2461 domain-containing protein [Gemmatirosa sp.]